MTVTFKMLEMSLPAQKVWLGTHKLQSTAPYDVADKTHGKVCCNKVDALMQSMTRLFG